MTSDRGPLTPAAAKKALFSVLRLPGVRVVHSYVAQDLANLRRAFPADTEFAKALLAVCLEIKNAVASPNSHGVAVRHDLDGWRRSKFSSGSASKSDLRLVFRSAGDRGVEILAFGDREFPDTVYHTAKRRIR